MRLTQTLKWCVFSAFVLSLWLVSGHYFYFDFPSGFIALDPMWHITQFTGGKYVWKYLYIFAIVVITSIFLGRFFCYYICPLGTSLDLLGKFMRSPKNYYGNKSALTKNFDIAPFMFTLVIISALFKLNIEHFFSPLSIASAFYGLLFNPFTIMTKGYINTFVHSFFIFLPFLLNLKKHRFWCNYICPSGWILGIISSVGLLKRMLNEKTCSSCHQCQKICPMNAINLDSANGGSLKINGDCHLCFQCIGTCPKQSIGFGLALRQERTSGIYHERRQFLGAAILGAIMATISTRRGFFVGDYKSAIIPKVMIRPPGSLPEQDFELMCIRCGICMAICPSNIIQPMGFENGLLSSFSPILVPRFGPCYPDCNLCGRFCPSGAIRELELHEKQWAKVGTAVINKATCIAYEWGKTCLICDEACPFDAITMVRAPDGAVLVPVVREERCNGCGACEAACPVIPEKAISVSAMGEIRLLEGSYMEEGKRRGLNLGTKVEGLSGRGELPPGFGE